METTLLGLERQSRATTALVGTLRFSLRLINYIFALLGLAILGYSLYLYWHVKHDEAISGYPWFIFMFGAVGIIVFITASTGLVGIARNSRFFLSMYGFLATMVLIAQAVIAVLFFTDNKWRKHIPDDPTGEQEKVAKFLKHNLIVVRWVGLAVLIIEVISILIAYGLSSAQRKLVETYGDEDDELWGRQASARWRAPEPVPASSSHTSNNNDSQSTTNQRLDPWSERMRDKYGLDTSKFTYDPTRTDVEIAREQAAESKSQRRCIIM